MATETEKLATMTAVLRNTRCACGRTKRARQAFCAADDQVLGNDATRAARYKLGTHAVVSLEMVEAYNDCCAWLYEQGYLAREVSL